MSWLGNLFGGGKPDKNKFGAIVNKHLVNNCGVEGKLVYDPNDFAIRIVAESDGPQQTYFLQNAYDDYCRSEPSNRKAVLDAYFQAAPLVPEALHDAIANVMPRLQVRGFFESVKLQQELGSVPKQDDAFAYRVMADAYAMALIYDSPKHVAYIDAQKLRSWETSFDELLERALVNLDRITPEPFQRTKDGVYYSNYGDTHDATRLLLKSRIGECRVNGRVIACSPNRNRLFVTGENDFAAQAEMIALTDQCLKTESRPLPVFPLVFDGKDWVLWAPPKDNPHRQEFRRLSLLAWAEEYGNQKAALDALHHKHKKDVFVANFMVFQNEAGELSSVATITKDVPSVIPKADRIAFVTPPKDSAIFMWENAAAVLGDKLQPIDRLWPERFSVNYFPTAEEMKRLREIEPEEMKA